MEKVIHVVEVADLGVIWSMSVEYVCQILVSVTFVIQKL